MDDRFRPKPKAPSSPEKSVRQIDFTNLINSRNFSPAIKNLLIKKAQEWKDKGKSDTEIALLLFQSIAFVIDQFTQEENMETINQGELEKLEVGIDEIIRIGETSKDGKPN